MEKHAKGAKGAKVTTSEAATKVANDIATKAGAAWAEHLAAVKVSKGAAVDTVKSLVWQGIDGIRKVLPQAKPGEVVRILRDAFKERDGEGNVKQGPKGPKYVIPSATLTWAVESYAAPDGKGSPTNTGKAGTWAKVEDLKLRQHAKKGTDPKGIVDSFTDRLLEIKDAAVLREIARKAQELASELDK